MLTGTVMLSNEIRTDCNANVELSFIRLDGFDHEWPNRDGLGFDDDIDAASSIWEFMQKFNLNGLIEE